MRPGRWPLRTGRDATDARWEAGTLDQRESNAVHPLAQAGSTRPQPWRDVVAPQPDIATGRYVAADFAADLGQVMAGGPSGAYGDARAFFATTYLTEGLRRLLTAAASRVAGSGGEPVIQLRSAFGGGKTHALLALYHLCRGTVPAERLAGVRPLLAAASVRSLPTVRLAALGGTDLSPGRPWPSMALGGRAVRTLWGELAAQLGGPEAYAQVRREDEQGVAPGAAALAALLQTHGPCVVLADELVAFLRPLHTRRDLSAGSFDANLSFVHNLTEAVRRTRDSLLVATLPAGDIEAGGEGGHAAAGRLAAILGRIEAISRPVAPGEGCAIVRRRLFQAETDAEGVESTCRTFAAMYAAGAGSFPPDSRDAAYLARLRAAYPIHPELFDRLEADWSGLEGFPRLRGMLRLLAGAVHTLWRRRDLAPLILPAGLPMDAPAVREPLVRAVGWQWDAVIAASVDGEGSAPAAIEREDPRLGQMPRRIARTLFIASAPGAVQQSGRPYRLQGVEAARIRLGALLPEDGAAVFNDALERLGERAPHLHGDETRRWLAVRPNLLYRVQELADGLDAHRAEGEVHARLRALARRVPREVLGGTHLVHRDGEPLGRDPWPPDDAVARLVVLPPTAAYTPRLHAASAAVPLAGALLAARTHHPNMIVFLAADDREVAGLLAAARQYLAWAAVAQEVVAEVTGDRRPLAAGHGGEKRQPERATVHSAATGDRPPPTDGAARQQARRGVRHADQTLTARLYAAYQWILAPAQDGTGPIRWEATHAPGDDDPLRRAVRRAVAARVVHGRWSPAELRLELDRWLWNDAPHIGVRTLWHHLTRHLYLPRLGQEGVLVEAIARGVASGEYFGYADGITPEGRYTGLRIGVAGVKPRCDATSLLVKTEVARAQVATALAASRPGGARGTYRATCADVDAVRPVIPGPLAPDRQPGTPEGAPPTRFLGAVALDPLQPTVDAGRVADEILRHLVTIDGAQVVVTLRIEAHLPAGLPPALVRTIRENAAALHFLTATFQARAGHGAGKTVGDGDGQGDPEAM